MELLSRAMLTMLVYNILAVVVLQGSNHSTKGSDRGSWSLDCHQSHYYFFTVACRH